MIDPRRPDFEAVPFAEAPPLWTHGGVIGSGTPVATQTHAHAQFDSSPPLVSVVTPLWNTPGELLVATASCVLGQSLRAIEWVIVDDGTDNPSTRDALKAILQTAGEQKSGQGPHETCAGRGPTVRVIRHDHNRGLPASRNSGFVAARAPYVFLLDADDLIEPTTLEKCAWYLHTHPEASFVKGYSVGFGAQRYLWTRGFEEEHAFLTQNQVSCTAMIRRDTHQALGGFDESLRTGPDDWDFWLKAAHAGHWGATIPEFLDWYRRRPSNERGWNTVDRAARRAWFLEESRRRYPALFDASLFDASQPEHVASTCPPGEAFRRCIARRFESATQREPTQELTQALAHGPLARASIAAHATGMGVNHAWDNARRALVVVDRLDIGASDGVCPRRLEQLIQAGWQLTVVATAPSVPVQAQMTEQAIAAGVSPLTCVDPHADLAIIARRTPDVFIAQNYVPASEVETFVSYLAASRGVDQIIQGLPPTLRRLQREAPGPVPPVQRVSAA